MGRVVYQWWLIEGLQCVICWQKRGCNSTFNHSWKEGGNFLPRMLSMEEVLLLYVFMLNAIGHIKNYTILKGTLLITMIHIANQIVSVCAWPAGAVKQLWEHCFITGGTVDRCTTVVRALWELVLLQVAPLRHRLNTMECKVLYDAAEAPSQHNWM